MINKIDYCTNRTITDSFQDIEEIVKFIKNPPPEHKELVEYARTIERDSKEYRTIKISKLPAISINFSFSHGYLKGDNISTPTGYLYIDVDGKTEQDLEINTAYICAYWRSLSNTGLTLVVKVDGLTPDNFKTATQEIANVLDIPFDKHAVSIDRLTVLSYDPNAYYNDNVEVFPIVELVSEQSVELSSTGSKNFRNTIIKYNSLIGIYCDGKIGIRYNNLDDVTQGMEIIYDDNGIYDCGQDKVKYHTAFMPKRVSKGNREKTLGLYAKRLLFLNPDLDKKILSKMIFRANMINLQTPLENSEVRDIIDKAFDNRQSPRTNKTKRFFFEDVTLTAVEKSRKCLEVLNQERRQKTQEKKNIISELFCNWNCHTDGKVSPKKVMELTGLKKTMVYNYFKDNKASVPNCDNP
ncbi:hypothetical protein CQ046_22465 [Chryseobacterium sp. MYb7]|uniref:BT4734/BF3469 family protein n=1 Tax=Chryseobacterium sp. MYb7 TaxID=1827290 RepID=UPI000D0025C6|nr:BT4734/BF3469 family protein [Chryseobacterium sp. MYb7]PRA94552.1 hypothetical protein CQ046_22465 [Chryseobacterium sp. MYb7]